MKFQVGVIGATGYIGTPYREEIRQSPQDATIVALCARRQDLLAAAGKEDGARLVTSDWREVVDHPDVNFVVVATPDALHYDPVMACAQRHKHVLCEKPVGKNVREAREMLDACRAANCGHFVPFWTRYVPIFARARQIVQDGTLGDVRSVIYRWHNPRPAATPFTWRDDAELSAAGSIADVGSHAYDVMRWILRRDAVRVLAHADVITSTKPDLGEINLDEALVWGESHANGQSKPTRPCTAFDYAAISFELEGGTVCSLVLSHATYLRKGLAPELELHGTDASLAVDRNTGDLTLVRPDQRAQLLETMPDPGFGNRFGKHVFPAIRAQLAGEPTEHPDLEDGWRAQLFTDAAALSARRGTWAELTELDNSLT